MESSKMDREIEPVLSLSTSRSTPGTPRARTVSWSVPCQMPPVTRAVVVMAAKDDVWVTASSWRFKRPPKARPNWAAVTAVPQGSGRVRAASRQSRNAVGAVVENVNLSGVRQLDPQAHFYLASWSGARSRATLPGGNKGIANQLERPAGMGK